MQTIHKIQQPPVSTIPALKQPGPQVAPVLPLIDLLNTLEQLAAWLPGEIRKSSWTNAYLLAAGMQQILADYLNPDWLLLNRAIPVLKQLPAPFNHIIVRLLEHIRDARQQASRLGLNFRRAHAWQAPIEGLVQLLALAAIDPAAVDAQPIDEHTRQITGVLVDLPARLRHQLLRLPSCFRSFDQRPEDLKALISRFAQGWPDRDRSLLVCGVRTSGSYLAPLLWAYLNEFGYSQVELTTIRPGRGLSNDERRKLRRIANQGGLLLVCDDPPTTGNSLLKVCQMAEKEGFSQGSIVLTLQLFTNRHELPDKLSAYPAVLLPWEEWNVQARMAPQAVQAELEKLWGSEVEIRGTRRLPEDVSPHKRHHLHNVYRLDLSNARRQYSRYITVQGVGMGYFGEHWLAVERALAGKVSPLIGLKDGLAFLEGPSDADHPSPGPDSTAAPAIARYVYARSRALSTPADTSLCLFGQSPMWEVASNLFSQVFGRAWKLARIPLVDPIFRQLLKSDSPSVVDGNMGPQQWSRTSTNADGWQKLGYAERDFCNLDMYCYDPLYDLACASVDIADPHFQTELLRVYQQLSGKPVSPERRLVYSLVHLWDLARQGRQRAGAIRRASAQAMQAYFAEYYFGNPPPETIGSEICAIDIDGVLETSPLGFPSLSPASASALRALIQHGFPVVLATGRSLDEVRERCSAYHLIGGVAEYGAVIYLHNNHSSRSLLSEAEMALLEHLRSVLSQMGSIALDDDYRYSVRAFQPAGTGTHALTQEQIVEALSQVSSRTSLRTIQGQAQTDFVIARLDKRAGLQALAQDLYPGETALPLALAVGDTTADLSMLTTARYGFAPGHAQPELRPSGIHVVRQPYQAGLFAAVTEFFGHAPGTCPTCRRPPLSKDARRLQTLLSVPENGKVGMIRRALAVYFSRS